MSEKLHWNTLVRLQQATISHVKSDDVKTPQVHLKHSTSVEIWTLYYRHNSTACSTSTFRAGMRTELMTSMNVSEIAASTTNHKVWQRRLSTVTADGKNVSVNVEILQNESKRPRICFQISLKNTLLLNSEWAVDVKQWDMKPSSRPAFDSLSRMKYNLLYKETIGKRSGPFKCAAPSISLPFQMSLDYLSPGVGSIYALL